MRLLITNSVPLNGGDEALLRATVESLQARWPGMDLTVLCMHAEQARAQLPDISIQPDLEFARDSNEQARIIKLYREADLVLSAPGGFLHDFYPISERLRGFEVAIELGKPVVLFAQSIGPFWKADSCRRVRDVLNRVARICVRDAASKQHLVNCGVDPSKIRETADAAFLWRRLAPDLFQPKSGPVRSIALAFRVWPLGDNIEVQRTIDKADKLCQRLLADPHRTLVFLSTCQGLDGYVDDSSVALEILKRLPPKLRGRCRVDPARYGPRELIQIYGRCDAFIGMRLHGCILSMLGGTPAFGFGYEQKTEEVFRQLNLSPYQARFDTNWHNWLSRIEQFLRDVPMIRSRLQQSLDTLATRAALNLDYTAEALTASSTQEPAMKKCFVLQ
jgi:polysaccharide pyruvyl transferase WcaK-like protein